MISTLKHLPLRWTYCISGVSNRISSGASAPPLLAHKHNAHPPRPGYPQSASINIARFRRFLFAIDMRRDYADLRMVWHLSDRKCLTKRWGELLCETLILIPTTNSSRLPLRSSTAWIRTSNPTSMATFLLASRLKLCSSWTRSGPLAPS